MVFNDNKYSRWYNDIINNANNRIPLTCYIEKHHIIPKSLGGGDHKDNIVSLTAREHFICHWLLTKMTFGNQYYKMLYAFHAMRIRPEKYSSKITARAYSNLKEEFTKVRSIDQKRIEESRPESQKKEIAQKISSTYHNKTQQEKDAIKKKQSLSAKSRTRRPFSDQAKKNMSLSHTPENNSMFNGYYITPWGKYASKSHALLHMPPPKIHADALTKYCKKLNKTNR